MEKTINHGRSNGGHNEFTLSLPHRCIRFTRCQIEVTSGGPSQPHVDIIPVAGFGAAIGGGVGAVAAEAKSLTLLRGAANRVSREASATARCIAGSSGAAALQRRTRRTVVGVGWRRMAGTCEAPLARRAHRRKLQITPAVDAHHTRGASRTTWKLSASSMHSRRKCTS